MRLFVPILAPLAASACLISSEPADQLALSMDLSSNRMRPDSPITVRLRATNPTVRPIHLETTGGCVLAFSLRSPHEVPVGPAMGCPDILETIEVAPGESITRAFTLAPGARWHSGEGLIRWPAGTYEVTGFLLGRDAQVIDRTESARFELVCSNPEWTEC